MSQPRPRSASDLALAPVLINIERNLARLRASADLQFALALDLNDDDSWYSSAKERAQRVLRSATRDVDLHGWMVTPTPDRSGLAVSRGQYTVSMMLGAKLADYVEHGRRHLRAANGRGQARTPEMADAASRECCSSSCSTSGLAAAGRH
jgi:hypothetical protein